MKNKIPSLQQRPCRARKNKEGKTETDFPSLRCSTTALRECKAPNEEKGILGSIEKLIFLHTALHTLKSPVSSRPKTLVNQGLTAVHPNKIGTQKEGGRCNIFMSEENPCFPRGFGEIFKGFSKRGVIFCPHYRYR